MLFLLGLFGANVIFIQTLRFSQEKKVDKWPLLTVNYLFAALVILTALFFSKASLGSAFQGPFAVAGLVNGFLYSLHLWIVMKSYESMGVGITSAVMASGAAVPIIFSHFVWNEVASALQWTALSVLPFAVYLMRSSGPNTSGHGAGAQWLVLFNFLVGGTIATIHKGVILEVGTNSLGYQLLIFSSAFVFAGLFTVSRGFKRQSLQFFFGAPIGLFNSCQTLCLMGALTVFPAAFVFPSWGSSTISLNLLAAWILWKEKISVRQGLGLVLAVAVVIFSRQ